MSGFRVLVTRHVYAEALELLRPVAAVTYHDDRDGMRPEELVTAIADQDALLCQLTDHVDAPLIAAGSRLRVIANVAVGYDNIDVDAARARGIVVTNTPGVLTESTADLAFALLMAVARRLTEAERFLRAGKWRQWEIDLMSGRDVHGRALGIIGMGRIGQALARRARGFGMRVVYHSRTRLDPDVEAELGVTFLPFEELLGTVEFVSLHVPLNSDTHSLLGASELARMRPDAILINTSRGPILDESALVAALRERRIAGAGLDVFTSEPYVDPRLLELDNVVLLPHIASSTVETRTKMCCMAAANVVAVAEGRNPPHPVSGSSISSG